jgi:hypothetical protein
MKEFYDRIPIYIPQICPIAKRVANHFECGQSCPVSYQAERYICPCFGRDGGGWIRVDEQTVNQMIEEVKRWNECRKTIPYKDAYTLKDVSHFRVVRFDLVLEQFGQDEAEEVKEELVKLLDNGDKISFNEDWGVGKIERNDDKTYTVIKWYYHSESVPVEHGSIDDVFAFLWDFWDHPEPFSYTKAGHPELEHP